MEIENTTYLQLQDGKKSPLALEMDMYYYSCKLRRLRLKRWQF